MTINYEHNLIKSFDLLCKMACKLGHIWKNSRKAEVGEEKYNQGTLIDDPTANSIPFYMFFDQVLMVLTMFKSFNSDTICV